MGIDVKKLAEQRRAELENRQKAAIARWKPYIDIVEKHYQDQGKELFEYQKANINISTHAAELECGVLVA
jgi:hypothetical protein